MFNGKAIKTQFDDALAVLDNKSLADRLAQSKMKRQVKSETESGLVIKAMRECPACGAKMTAEDVDCPECGKMVGKAVPQAILPEEMKSGKMMKPEEEVAAMNNTEEAVESPEEEATEDESTETAADKNKKRAGNARVEAESTMTMAKSDVEEKHLPGKHDQQSHAGKQAGSSASAMPKQAGKLPPEKEMKVAVLDYLGSIDERSLVDAAEGFGIKNAHDLVFDDIDKLYSMLDNKLKGPKLKDFYSLIEEYKSLAEDGLMSDASAALDIVQKAIAAPGGDRTELLAQAANLVNAVRDYAHSIANTSAPMAAGVPTAEAAAAVQDLNPAPQPGQKVGGNLAPVPEEEVVSSPQETDEQEDATETPEEQADETLADEQEEGRLHFAKQPNNENKKKAMKPPVPVVPPVGQSVKARTQPNAVVKSAAKHPAEAFVLKWASSLAPILVDVTTSRTAKREAVQKALNDFAPGIVKVIEDTTPATEQDLSMVVQDEIQKALAERDSQYQSVIEQLQQKVAALTTMGEVKSQVARRPFKKSFSAQAPVSAGATPSGPVVLAGDQTPMRRLSAAEVARSSVVSAGGSFIRY